ncbi:MAG: membrane protein insertase YidC [Pseudomonadota bacterium]
MDINKRTILWIVFSLSLVILWNDWMVSNGKQSLFGGPAPAVASAKASASAVLPSAAAVAATPGAPAAEAAPVFKAETITITTDLVKADIDTQGGVLKRLELLKYKDALHPEKNEVLFDATAKGTSLAQTGLVGAPGIPNHTTGFTAKPGVRTLADGTNEVQLVLEAEQGGVKLTKTFSFKRGDYTIGVRHDVTNTGAAAVSPSLYLQLTHDGSKPEGNSYFNSSSINPIVYTDAEKYQKLDFEHIETSKKCTHARDELRAEF